jgi:predicted patatin/cPLA2 family phospholipase
MPETIPGLRVLQARVAGGDYAPGSQVDGFKVGLCLDGGASQGITSLGMGTALAEEGLLSVADGIYGDSAGAVNGAYLVADQLETAKDFYFWSGEKTLDMRRVLKGRWPIDRNIVTGTLTDDAPLDTDRALRSELPLAIGVTNVSDYTADRVSNKKITSGSELIEWLARSTRLPIFAGIKPMYDKADTAWADGGLSWTSLEQMAIDDGCTHVISLASKRYRRFHTGQRLVRGATYVIGKWLEQYGQGTLEQYQAFITEQARTLDWQPGGVMYQGSRIDRYYPVGTEALPARSTRKRERLLQGHGIGRATIHSALSGLAIA